MCPGIVKTGSRSSNARACAVVMRPSRRMKLRMPRLGGLPDSLTKAWGQLKKVPSSGEDAEAWVRLGMRPAR